MIGFVGGERSDDVGDSLDFEVSQQVALHLPLRSHPPSGSLAPPPTPVRQSFPVQLSTHISPLSIPFLSQVMLVLLVSHT